MECEDVALLLRSSERPTLSGKEESQLRTHLDTCATCQALAAEPREGPWRVVARLPDRAFADPDQLVLPEVDPSVFEVDQELARGGMGKISRARDRRLGRDVALKQVLDPAYRARFEREAAITARLQHPAIVPIYEAGTWPDGSAFYTMRLVPGGTLSEAIRGKATLAERLSLLPHLIAVTEALAYAHAQRIIHRDLKPGNVLVGEFGETVVIDWGLAKQLDRDGDDELPHGAAPAAEHGLTIAGVVLGTPGFMSPEQAMGEPLDERADVYALGSILYCLISGVPPYHDEVSVQSGDELLEVQRARKPTPIATLAPEAPADLCVIVERAMARPLDERYRTAKEMAAELRRFEAGQLIAREYSPRELIGRWIRKHRTTVAVAAIAVLVLAGVGTAAIVNVTRSRDAERTAREDAERATLAAEASFGATLEEQGRGALVGGERARALAYLSAAYSRGRNSPAMRHMLAAASAVPPIAMMHDIALPRFPVAIAFLPDGRLATIDRQLLTLWAGHTAEPSTVLGEAVKQAWFSADGTRALVRVEAGALAMWDVPAGKQLWTASDPVFANELRVAFDPRSAVILFPEVSTADTGKGLQLRSAATGRSLAAPAVATVGAVAINPDGGRAAIADTGDQPRLTIVDTATGTALGSTTLPDTVSSLAFVNSIELVAGTRARDAYLVGIDRLAAAPRTLGGHRGIVWAVASDPERGRFATAERDGRVHLWSGNGEPLGESDVVHHELESLAFSPDGELVLATSADLTVSLMDASSLARIADIDAGDVFGDVVWDRKSAAFATIEVLDQRVRVWRAPREARIAQVRADAMSVTPTTMFFGESFKLAVYASATGAELAHFDSADFASEVVASRDGATVHVHGMREDVFYDAATGSKLARFEPTSDHYARMVMSDDGKRVILIDEGIQRRVRVLDIRSRTAVFDQPVNDLATPGTLSPDGTILLQPFDGHPLQGWRLPAGTPIEVPPLPAEQVRMVAFAPSGTRYVAFGGPIAFLVDERSHAVTGKLTSTSTEPIVAVRFDAAEERILTFSDDGVVRLWTAATGALNVAVTDVSGRAFAIAADGERFATGSGDGAVRIWDTRGRLLQIIHPSRSPVDALAFTAGDTRLVALAGGQASTWDVHLEQRPATEIAALARATGWELRDGVLVRARSSPSPARP